MLDLTGVVAEPVGRPSDDFAAATLAGAMLGVMFSAELYWSSIRAPTC
jgi:hypothetical protein